MKMTRRFCNIFLSVLTLFMFGSCATRGYLYLENPEEIYQRAMGYYGQEKWNKASRYFENVVRVYVNTAREDSIMFFNARCKFKDGDYHTAITHLENYRYQFSRSKFLEEADGMLALSYYYISPGPERDPTNVGQALSSIDEFMSRYPESDNIVVFGDIREELVGRLQDRSYLNAYTYYKIGQYKSAIVAFKNALKEYPDTKNREKIMYYMNVSGYELARNSIPSLERDRYLALVDMYYSFIAEFPESQYRKDLDRISEAAKRYLEKSEAK